MEILLLARFSGMKEAFAVGESETSRGTVLPKCRSFFEWDLHVILQHLSCMSNGSYYLRLTFYDLSACALLVVALVRVK